jgi:hypothetical protein
MNKVKLAASNQPASVMVTQALLSLMARSEKLIGKSDRDERRKEGSRISGTAAGSQVQKTPAFSALLQFSAVELAIFSDRRFLLSKELKSPRFQWRRAPWRC